MDHAPAETRLKILYAIQRTGNGHLSRARDIIPILRQKGDLDILISGSQADVELPYPVKYKLSGLSFIFGKKGGIDVMATFRKSNLKRLYREMKLIPVEDYDLVINDFEPVSAWACRMKHKTCVGLSHQAAVISKKSPKPKKKDRIGKSILMNYAPVTVGFGFHFEAYESSIFTPVIRSQIRNAVPEDKKHFTVYLPAYSDERITRILSEIKNIEWQVFSKHAKKEYRENHIHIRPVQNDAFVESLINCSGILCGAGFETPAEALFLKKRLLVIPMKGQYEQQCNAAAVHRLGVPVLKSLKKKHVDRIKEWTESPPLAPVYYPDHTETILDMIIHKYSNTKENARILGSSIHSAKKLREKGLAKILNLLSNK